MSDLVIECKNVRRVFNPKVKKGESREVVAVKDLNFSVPRGIVFGLLGPNGSGKTTTIRMLSTLLIPTSGEAKVFGFDVVKEAGNVREHIGLILGGDKGFYGRLTGIENLRYFAAINNINGDAAKKRIQEVLETVNLTSSADRLVEQYSRGMRQRLHIARGILTNPDVLFMDEPTVGIDPQGAQELRQLIPLLVGQGKTILLTTHYMYEADEVSNQIAIINKGEMVASGTPSQIKRQFSKIEIYEVILRKMNPSIVKDLCSVKGIERVVPVSDGPVQKLTIQAAPNDENENIIKGVVVAENIESITKRDPTLEEAYLSIIK
jgi:ABC-2 type transport system ATP-binding protein